jgi:hypothetical protein
MSKTPLVLGGKRFFILPDLTVRVFISHLTNPNIPYEVGSVFYREGADRAYYIKTDFLRDAEPNFRDWNSISFEELSHEIKAVIALLT